MCCGGSLAHPHDDSFDSSSERLETPFLSRAPPHFSPTLCPDRGTPEPSCTPARVSHATLAPMHHSPQLLCSAGPSSTPPARACSCAKLEPSRSLCTRFRPVLATPGAAGDDFWRNLCKAAGGLLRWCTGRWALPRDRQCVVHFCAPADRCIVLHRRFAYHVPRQPGREPQGRDASTEWASSTQAARLPGCCGGA